jgi:hypothetical protein
VIGGVPLTDNTHVCLHRHGHRSRDGRRLHDGERGYMVEPAALIVHTGNGVAMLPAARLWVSGSGCERTGHYGGQIVKQYRVNANPKEIEMTTQTQVQQAQPQQQSQAQSQGDKQDDRKITVVVKPRKARPVLIPVHL